MSLSYGRRQHPKVPKDGPGPRGAPDCYYTSRVLNSTFLYVQFVKKLRQQEEDERISIIRDRKEKEDIRNQKFFNHCDRRRLIGKITNRVDLCLQAYDDYLKEKRQKLLDLYTAEEVRDMRLLVANVQAGKEAAWNDKMEHLKYLLAKRQKEHEDLYQATPLSKSSHVLPCIFKLRSKEAEEIQLYQMREKQMRKLAEKEMDKMWHDVILKETEALAARSEYDCIERYRRDQQSKLFSLEQMKQQRIKRAKEQEMLKQETLRLKAKFESDNRKAEEEERMRKEEQRLITKTINDMMEDRKAVLAQRQLDSQVIGRTWDSLAGQGLADEQAKEQRRRQKERELDECNRKMVEMKNRIADLKYDSDPLIFKEEQRQRDIADLKRCRYRVYTKKLQKETGLANKKRLDENEIAKKNRQCDEKDEYSKQVSKQLEQLVKYKQLTDKQARKLNSNDLQKQIEYNKLLQERAKQEAMIEEKKCRIARDQYQEEIKKMLSRPFFSDHLHPFMKQMTQGKLHDIKQMDPKVETSRVLNSTGHYVRFIKKLRTMEEENRIFALNAKSKAKDNECVEFFTRCDRRSLINQVEDRVKFCMQSYEDELAVKRQKLKEFLCNEEEQDIRKLVENVQSGHKIMWEEKMARLAYLLDKRKKEHESLYSDTPLSKCAHVLPCIIKLQAKEAEEIQLYQMREKQMRKLAENEMDRMWNEVVMNEADALAARMEYDAIERLRRDLDAKNYTLQQIESKRVQREKEQEMLRQEFLQMKAKFEEDNKKAEEEELRKKNERYELGQQKLDMIKERKEVVAKLQADIDYVNQTWDSLATQGLADERAKVERWRQKERDLFECNQKMAEMKYRVAETKFNNDPLILEEGQRRQDAKDLERCQRRLRAKKANKANQAAILQQSKEKREAVQETEMAKARDEYNREVTKQLDQLVKHKQLTDAQARKLHQTDLVRQMEYNQLLKDRAREEMLNETKKCQIAMDEYQEQIKKMLCRPFYSDRVHPFMQQMASGLKMAKPCPCSKPTYCLTAPPTEPPKQENE